MDGSRIRINIRRRSISSKRSKTTLQQLKQQKLYTILLLLLKAASCFTHIFNQVYVINTS